MTRIDFYVINAETLQDRHFFACRLAEKAFKQGLSVYIYHHSEAILQSIDELLWSFKSDSFIPHQHITTGSKLITNTSVYLGNDEPPEPIHDLLINLAADIPAFFSRFVRLSEVVTPQNDITQQTREHFKYYRNKGYPMTTHNLK